MCLKRNLSTFVLAAFISVFAASTIANAKPYKCAEIFTNEAYLYGKYVFRMQAAKASGIISNFFLWKEGSELSDVFWEEVDIEVFGKDQADALQTNIITGLDHRITSEQIHSIGSLGDKYHTYTLEWTPDKVRWLVDGKEIRVSTGGQAGDLVNPSQMRFNFWPPDSPEWVGPWNDDILPIEMFVNWVEYYSWDGSRFNFEWRDDFDSLNPSRWGTADWTFAENRADFVPANAVTKNGYLVLAMTHEGQEGYDGMPPEDNTQSNSSYSCNIGKFTKWRNGFVVNNVSVTNTGSKAINAWQVYLKFSQPIQITGAWNAEVNVNGMTVEASGNQNTSNLNPGETAVFGFKGSHNAGDGFIAPICDVPGGSRSN